MAAKGWGEGLSRVGHGVDDGGGAEEGGQERITLLLFMKMVYYLNSACEVFFYCKTGEIKFWKVIPKDRRGTPE